MVTPSVECLRGATDEELAQEIQARKDARALAAAPVPIKAPDFWKLIDRLHNEVKYAAVYNKIDPDLKGDIFDLACDAVYGQQFWEWRNKQPW